jgi:two-component system, LuxR family, response regulator FixJ
MGRSGTIEQTDERREARRMLDRLTPREFQVLRCVIAGKPNKVIAYELLAAEKTVKVHRRKMRDKLGLHSVPDLVRFAQRAGVEPMP